MKSRNHLIAACGIVAASALVLAGCGQAPDASTDTEATSGAPAAPGFKPCMVSDFGGFQDRSFNQLGYEGLQSAAAALGVDATEVESANESEFDANMQNLVDQECSLIVTVGYALAETANDFAKRNPEIDFVSIDDPVDIDQDGLTDQPNVKGLLYDAAQGAFLAGYVAASVSETKKVGTFGGMEYPTVTIFMDGFKQGVEYYNDKHAGDPVEVIGMNVFTGGFTADPSAVNAAQGVVDQNVDVLLPVGGPIYQSAAAVIRDSGRDIAMIGVDADLYESDESVKELMLTSILKRMDVSVEEAVLAAGQGAFDATPYVGTLENDGVGIAPFHDWADRVPDGLAAELDEIRAGIIDGSITVESYLK